MRPYRNETTSRSGFLPLPEHRSATPNVTSLTSWCWINAPNRTPVIPNSRVGYLSRNDTHQRVWIMHAKISFSRLWLECRKRFSISNNLIDRLRTAVDLLEVLVRELIDTFLLADHLHLRISLHADLVESHEMLLGHTCHHVLVRVRHFMNTKKFEVVDSELVHWTTTAAKDEAVDASMRRWFNCSRLSFWFLRVATELADAAVASSTMNACGGSESKSEDSSQVPEQSWDIAALPVVFQVHVHDRSDHELLIDRPHRSDHVIEGLGLGPTKIGKSESIILSNPAPGRTRNTGKSHRKVPDSSLPGIQRFHHCFFSSSASRTNVSKDFCVRTHASSI